MTNKEIDNIFPQSYKGTAFISDLRLLVKSLSDAGYLNDGNNIHNANIKNEAVSIDEIQEIIKQAISEIKLPKAKKIALEKATPANDPGNLDEDATPENFIDKFNTLLDNLRDAGLIK
jgi:hypothetical protein